MEPPISFVLNGEPVEVGDPQVGESLLSVLRERLGMLSVKDGCAPQGQCGCCTVLVDGEPRVSCVTPAARVDGRSVTTIEGLDAATRAGFADAFVETGGSQCGFCTPGIVMRFAGTRARDLDRALAAHLCRCTGWLTVREAIANHGATVDRGPMRDDGPTGDGERAGEPARDLALAARRAALEAGGPQRVDPAVPLGGAQFADDTAPRDALVAVPLPPGSPADSVEAAGLRFVVAATLLEARTQAEKVQGRRTTVGARPPLLDRMPPCPPGGVQLATQWVEPAYLEPDASWCEPGGEPASPLANAGAFGAKLHSAAPAAARELAGRFGRPVRVVYAREDVVRLGPKRPPIAAVATHRDGVVEIDGVVARGAGAPRVWPAPPGVAVRARWTEVSIPGPPVSFDLRAAGLAEQAVLVAGALGADVPVVTPSGAQARAHVEVERGRIVRVAVELAAGDPLDEVVLRSYAIGAAHMALGWVTSESLAVDAETGEIHDLTIRSFGILRAAETPPVVVTLLDDPAPARARSTDAVFAAVAAAAWNALGRPVTLPAPKGVPASRTVPAPRR